MNPTKQYLQAYRQLLCQYDAVREELFRARERGLRATSRMTAVRVSGTPAHDGMANAAVRAVDCETMLAGLTAQLEAALSARLAVIAAVADERQRSLLTMRYVAGWSWERIAREMHYEERQVFRLHGDALQEAARTQSGHAVPPIRRDATARI